MKTLRISLSWLAVALAVGGAFATTVQNSGWLNIMGRCSEGVITSPVDADITPCLVQWGAQCKITIVGVAFNAYDTEEHCQGKGAVGLLRYQPN